MRTQTIPPRQPEPTGNPTPTRWIGSNRGVQLRTHDLTTEWDEKTYRTFSRLALLPPAGIRRIQAFNYYDKAPSGFVHPWYQTVMPRYGVVDQSDLPKGRTFGITFET
ncbi:hypothetical protein HK101_005192, partial [Irineochytrium annulatum]